MNLPRVPKPPPPNPQLILAQRHIQQAESLSGLYWQATSPPFYRNRDKTRLLSSIVRGLQALSQPQILNDHTSDLEIVSAHTRLIWHWSRVDAADAVHRYQRMIQTLYTFWLNLRQADKVVFQGLARRATDGNPAWVAITKDVASRHAIMELAVTVSTQFYGEVVESRQSRELWEKRQ